MSYENFVFYGSWREALEGFKEDFGEDYAKEVLWNLMTFGTSGDINTSKKSIEGFINGTVAPNIGAAKDRYKASVENGKKGGRPSIELDMDEVYQKKEELGTWKAVAKHYGISEQTLKNKRDQWQSNPKNPKNLDKDIYNYIYNYNDNNNDNYKDKENIIIENSKNPKIPIQITDAAKNIGF